MYRGRWREGRFKNVRANREKKVVCNESVVRGKEQNRKRKRESPFYRIERGSKRKERDIKGVDGYLKKEETF